MKVALADQPSHQTEALRRLHEVGRLVQVEDAREEVAKEAASQRLPLGITVAQRCLKKRLSYNAHKYLALFLTFLIYATYHASRRPLNVVKPILSPYDEVTVNVESCMLESEETKSESQEGEGWEPFTGKSGEKLLVGLDFTFLFAYAIGVMLAGRIADRSNLRHYLLWGSSTVDSRRSSKALFWRDARKRPLHSCLWHGAFSFGPLALLISFLQGYFWGVHHYSFYLILQISTGFLQASGWPAVVAIVAQWFGKEHLGFIMGIWNAHASVGNSVGSAMSASVVRYGWGSSFLLLGSFIAGMGAILWFFIVPQPSDAGYNSLAKRETAEISSSMTRTPSTSEMGSSSAEKKSITWTAALSIPGVIPFSVSLFFSKFVAYTFLFWLPYYIASICIDGRQLTAEQAGDFSILFDLGGIAGGAAAGIFYDMSGSGAVVSAIYGLFSIPLLLIYNQLGRHSIPGNMTLLALCGFCVNGPYALITTAISASLGTHESIAGNERALSTVAAIIDGMGSLGAALGPTITGQILSSHIKGGGSFHRVFIMLALAALLGVLTLSRVAWFEIKHRKQPQRPESIEMERLVRKSSSV